MKEKGQLDFNQPPWWLLGERRERHVSFRQASGCMTEERRVGSFSETEGAECPEQCAETLATV